MNLGLLGTASKIHTISIFGSSVALVPTGTGRDEQPADVIVDPMDLIGGDGTRRLPTHSGLEGSKAPCTPPRTVPPRMPFECIYGEYPFAKPRTQPD